MTSYITNAIQGIKDKIVGPKVEGTVAPVEKKFEWNTALLYSHNENHSKIRTITVGVLSTLLVLPLLLTAIVDIGRRIAFAAGKCDGKSFSLLEKLSPTASKVADAVKEVLQPKELTPSEQLEKSNQTAKGAMRSLVKKLVQTYKDQNGGVIHNNHTFGDRVPKTATELKIELQESLAAVVSDYLERNATSENFDLHVSALKEELKEMFAAEAKASILITNKVEYGQYARIGDLGFAESCGSGDAIQLADGSNKAVLASPMQKVLSSTRIKVAGKEYFAQFPMSADKADAQLVPADKASSQLVKTLKKLVEEGKLTIEEAKRGIALIGNGIRKILVNTNSDASEGAKAGNRAAQQVFNKAKKEGLLTPEEVRFYNEGIQTDFSDLSTAAAREIASHLIQNPEDRKGAAARLPVIVKSLVKEGALNEVDVAEFKEEVEKKTQEFLDNPASLTAAQESSASDLADAKEATTVVSAPSSKSGVAKTRSEAIAQASELKGKYEHNLYEILRKEKTLRDEKYKAYSVLEEELKQMEVKFAALKDQQVEITISQRTGQKKRMSLLAVAKYRADKIAKINKKDIDPAAKKQRLQVFERTLDAEAGSLLKELHAVENAQNKHLETMIAAMKVIDGLHVEIKGMIKGYEVFAQENREEFKKIKEAEQKEVKKLEDQVIRVDGQLDLRQQRIHHKLSTLSELLFVRKDEEITVPALSLGRRLWNMLPSIRG